MTDMPYDIFLLLGVAALAFFVGGRAPREKMVTALLCGLAGGLASGIKFVGLPIIGIFFVLTLCLYWMAGRVTLRASFIYLAATAITGMAVVYLSTPNYWPRPSNVDAAALTGELHGLLLEGKKVPLGCGLEKGFMEVVSEIPFQRAEIRAAFPQTANLLLPPAEFFLLPLRWSKIYDRINANRHSEEPGAAEILHDNFIKYRSSDLETLLLFCSLAYCAYLTWRALKEGRIRKEVVFLLCFLAYTAFLALTLKLNVDRYYLPSIAMAAVISGVGFSAALDYIKPFFKLVYMKLAGGFQKN